MKTNIYILEHKVREGLNLLSLKLIYTVSSVDWVIGALETLVWLKYLSCLKEQMACFALAATLKVHYSDFHEFQWITELHLHARPKAVGQYNTQEAFCTIVQIFFNNHIGKIVLCCCIWSICNDSYLQIFYLDIDSSVSVTDWCVPD